MEAVISTGSEIATASSRAAPMRALFAGAYGVFGTALVMSRLVGLGKSFWLDEAIFVEYYVREGPRQILAGRGLSHEFYGLLDWGTGLLLGESAVAFRLWSAVPFILGVTVVTAWLHKRHDPLAGVAFLFLATVSPLLLDISRQARGYGIAFLAMALVIVCALEAKRSRRTVVIALLCVSGVIGTWTLPQFAIAYFSMLSVLVIDRRMRVRIAVGAFVSLAAILIWFWPHFQQIDAASRSEAGTTQITTTWLVTAPFDQIVLPALIWIDGATISASLAWLPFAMLVAIVMASSPFLRARNDEALVLLAGPVATILAFRLGDVHAAPRFLSFLLVPLFMLLASGSAAIVRKVPRRKATLRTALLLVAAVALTLHFAALAPDVIRLPREANREAARVIESRAPADAPVYALIKDPGGLDFYLDRPLHIVRSSAAPALVCDSNRPVTFVTQPWVVPRASVPCLARPGVEHFDFRQYARGHEIDVWLVPPAA